MSCHRDGSPLRQSALCVVLVATTKGLREEPRIRGVLPGGASHLHQAVRRRSPMTVADQIEKDNAQLRELGYVPILARAWGVLAAVGLVCSSMSILTSVVASFDWGLIYGGPVVVTWGWLGVSAIIMCVALNMAELASAMPQAGGMMYWAYRLAGAKQAKLAAWLAGWINIIAQISGNAAQAQLQAELTTVLINMFFRWQGQEPPEELFSPRVMLALYAAWLLLSAVTNSLGNRANIFFTQAGGVLNLGGCVLLCVVLPAVAKRFNTAEYVFTSWSDALAVDGGISSPAYIALLGMLLPAWAYTGLDSAAYLSEETVNAALVQPRAILFGCATMFVGGLCMCLSLLFVMPSIDNAVDEEAPAQGWAMAQIMYDVFEERFGSPLVGILLFFIPYLAVFTCNMSSLTYTARIVFAYARDHMVPFSGWLSQFNKHTKTPLAAVWGVTLISFILGLPMLVSRVAFQSLISLSTIALFIIYCAPTTLRITSGRRLFVPGPFCLGWVAYPLGVLSTCWMVAATAIFSLPTEYPVTSENFNYAPIVLIITVLLSLGWYYACKALGRPFRGPNFDIDAFEAEVLAHEQREAAEVGAGRALHTAKFMVAHE